MTLAVLEPISLAAFAQTPSRQFSTGQCTEMEIQKHIQQLSNGEPIAFNALVAASTFNALVACQSKAVPALIKALDTKNENVRIIIIAALGQIGSQASPAVPLLSELLVKDTSSDVRSMTVHALGQIDKDPILVLITDLKNEDWRVRYRAANTLGQIRAEAEDAHPSLTTALRTTALEDQVQLVRSSADNALQKIGTGRRRRICPYNKSCMNAWTVRDSTLIYGKNNSPVMCRISVIRAVLRWKCP
jgi:HEAT repeat protein